MDRHDCWGTDAFSTCHDCFEAKRRVHDEETGYLRDWASSSFPGRRELLRIACIPVAVVLGCFKNIFRCYGFEHRKSDTSGSDYTQQDFSHRSGETSDDENSLIQSDSGVVDRYFNYVEPECANLRDHARIENITFEDVTLGKLADLGISPLDIMKKTEGKGSHPDPSFPASGSSIQTETVAFSGSLSKGTSLHESDSMPDAGMKETSNEDAGISRLDEDKAQMGALPASGDLVITSTPHAQSSSVAKIIVSTCNSGSNSKENIGSCQVSIAQDGGDSQTISSRDSDKVKKSNSHFQKAFGSRAGIFGRLKKNTMSRGLSRSTATKISASTGAFESDDSSDN